jgi:hypothetical protein
MEDEIQLPPSKVEGSVAKWISIQIEAEIKRLSALSQRCIPVPVLMMAIVREAREEPPAGERVWNHVEFKTSFDFSKVKQILLNDPIPCPCKDHHNLVLLVLITDHPVPMLAPHIYDARVPNDLNFWVFVNSSSEKVRLQVDGFV